MKNLFIIDLMPFLYRGHFVFLKNPRLTASGINTSAILGLANGIMSIVKNQKPSHLILAMDSSTPTFRHQAYPQYKAQREKMPEDLAASIPYAYELAKALQIPVVKVDGYEADDILGTLAKKGEKAGFNVYLVTPDKDAAQLVDDNIFLFRPGHAGDKAEIYGKKEVCENWHIQNPMQMIDYLAMAGDVADNIPGIKGVGEKTARELLSQFPSLEELIEHASEIKGKIGEKILASKENAIISKFLATIKTDVPIEPDWDAYTWKGPDIEALKAVCYKFEFIRLSREFGFDIRPELNRPVVEDKKAITTIANTPHDYKLIVNEADARLLAEELQKCQTIAFDTETAPRDGYASTDEHHCKLVGFSLSSAPGKAWFVAADLVDLFRPLFADPSKTFIAHNAKFDCAVLRRYGIGLATTPHDTMLEHYCIDAASRHSLDLLSEQLLGYRPIPITALIGEKQRGKAQLSMDVLPLEKICDYAAEDADVAFRLEQVLRPQALALSNGNFPVAINEVEEPLIKILSDMEREGIKVDVETLKAYGRELDREILALLQEIRSYAEPGFNPDSPKQLGNLLFGKLNISTTFARKTTTGQFSTDEKTLSKIINQHPIVQSILEYRTCSKLKSTYVDKLPTLIDENGRVHTTFSQSFTETGRLSSADPNLQNIPIRTERGKMIRKAFIARDKNHKLISADYSQIELRLMAAFSQDESMLEAFRNGADIHRETASKVYGIMPEFVSPEQRSYCKMVNFGIIYGISPFGLSQRLKISRNDAAGLIESYFKLYPKVKEYMDKAIQEARDKGYASTILGRRRTIRDINSRNATARSAAERDAINTPIQGSAADLIKVAMLKVSKALSDAGLHAKMVLQIHDELIFDTPIEEVDEAMAIIKREMSSALNLGVNLDVGIGAGDNWLDAH